MKKHVQTDSEWQEEMSQKIIDEIQCELYLEIGRASCRERV